jgi:hypothetical protein
LNQAGWAVQPLGIQALSIHGVAASGLPAGTRPEFVELFRRGQAIAAEAFGYGAERLPAWMLRAGIAPPPPRRGPRRTLRLRVEQVLDLASRA